MLPRELIINEMENKSIDEHIAVINEIKKRIRKTYKELKNREKHPGNVTTSTLLETQLSLYYQYLDLVISCLNLKGIEYEYSEIDDICTLV